MLYGNVQNIQAKNRSVDGSNCAPLAEFIQKLVNHDITIASQPLAHDAICQRLQNPITDERKFPQKSLSKRSVSRSTTSGPMSAVYFAIYHAKPLAALLVASQSEPASRVAYVGGVVRVSPPYPSEQQPKFPLPASCPASSLLPTPSFNFSLLLGHHESFSIDMTFFNLEDAEPPH
jgi:hypothetical protein